MNERIRELAEQAGLKVNPDGEIGPAFFGSVDAGYRKFAESIVRQCAYHADVFSALGCPDDMDPTETKPSDYIKREMGIAE